MSGVARWDAFLAQVASRHRAVRADAEASARTVIVAIAAGGDERPLSHQLMAVQSRLQELESMITDTWHAKVEDVIIAEGHDRDRERAKGEQLRDVLEDERDELEPRVLAELARQRFAHAMPRSVSCSRCGVALAPPPLTFRALALDCRCGGSAVFEPGDLMRSVAAVGTHAVSQEAVVPTWRMMRVAERAYRGARSPRPLDVIVAYEHAQIAYWRAYLAVRAQFEPELARDPAREIRCRLDQWYTSSAEYEENWVKAGRPRAI